MLFFAKSPQAKWLRRADLEATLTNSEAVARDARHDMDNLLDDIVSSSRELRNGRDGETEVPVAAADVDLFAAPEGLGVAILDEIPRQDPTYQHIGITLITHTSIPDLTLLEYQTFGGSMAYQPCSKNIDLIGLFDSLYPIERGGDHVFKVARAWSCIVQAIEGLPKDLRWVLATIYDFANEMLRPGLDEDTLWSMRAWLMYWYDLADKLCEIFGVFASAPLTDWFLRPTAVNPEESAAVESDAVWSLCRTKSCSSSDSDTFYQNPLLAASTRMNHHDDIESPIPISPILYAWLNAQTDLWSSGLADFFDPTPGGFVSSSTRQDYLPVDERTELPTYRPNPRAGEFVPNSMLGLVGLDSRSSVVTREGTDCTLDLEEMDSGSDNDGVSCYCSTEASSRSSHAAL